MKFAQQLRQGAVEEWRRAYVDYRLLKKLIKAAARSADEYDAAGSEAERPINIVEPTAATLADHDHEQMLSSPPDSEVAAGFCGRGRARGIGRDTSSDEDEADGTRAVARRSRIHLNHASLPQRPEPAVPGSSSHRVAIARMQSRSSSRSDGIGAGNNSTLRRRKPSRPGSFRDPKWRYSPDIPLDEMIFMMNAAERKFFSALDQELDKVEAFYEEREAEAIERCKVLREQLDQLAEHRAEYLAKHSAPSRLVRPLLQQGKQVLPSTSDGNESPKARPESSSDEMASPGARKKHVSNGGPVRQPQATEEVKQEHGRRARVPQFDRLHPNLHYNPENYVNARRKLKLATFETYKYLGYVRNYRMLNRTGFSKATKKMEKMTRIKCQAAYMAKVEKTLLSSSTVIDDLQSQVESMFGASFEKGSRKKAIQRLRYMGASTNHHFASWRAGVLLGAAVPALIDGLVKSSQADVRARIPYYATILQIYGAMALPVLLAVGIGINLVGWNRAHINVPLVFYFDSRTMVDFRQYLEIPTFFLCTLAYCLWLSFTVVSSTISPQVWPLVWLFSTIAVLFNPAPIFHKNARWWIIRSTLRVITAGLVRVEFRDFWLGDQFCSLYYTSINLGFLVCAYTHHFAPDVGGTCSTNRTWATPVLASLPYLWRLGQSFRRYADSREVKTHLVNAGKYSCSVVYYFFYYNYRIRGSHRNATFALFIVFATINSCFSLAWDLIMDWNLFRRNSRHRFLRNELGFRSQQWFYYFAILTNIPLRFSWVIYVAPDTSLQLKGFLVSLVETYRRWQWNFIRVESEHVGNVDGFRVTRDVPLPYTIPNHPGSSAGSMQGVIMDEEDEEDNDDESGQTGPRAGDSGERFRQEIQAPQAPGALDKMLPGRVGRKLRAVILGRRKAAAVDESEDEEEDGDGDVSPATDGELEGIEAPESVSPSHGKVRQESGATAASQVKDVKNYNTFGWDSERESAPVDGGPASRPGPP